MVLAEDSAAAGQGVVLKLPGLLIVAQDHRSAAEEAGRAERVGVVLAQDSAAAGEGFLLQLPGLLRSSFNPKPGSRLILACQC